MTTCAPILPTTFWETIFGGRRLLFGEKAQFVKALIESQNCVVTFPDASGPLGRWNVITKTGFPVLSGGSAREAIILAKGIALANPDRAKIICSGGTV